MTKGVFIVIEGIDGAGKGNVMMRLQEYIMGKSKKYDHLLLTREPTFGPIGSKARELLASESDPYKNAQLCLALYTDDRKWHCKEHIKPALDKGYVVLCDRYKHSTYAFQQTQGLTVKEIHAAHDGVLVPDLTIVLDVDVSVALSRMNGENRGGSKAGEKFEKKEFMEKLRGKYLELPKLFPNEKIVVINANFSKEQVTKDAIKALEDSNVLPW